MTTRRPRLTVRRLMIAVALAGLLFDGEKMRRVRSQRASKAVDHETGANFSAWDAGLIEESIERVRSLAEDAVTRQRLANLVRERESVREHERWDRELASKYARAANRPWLPLEADPPEPSIFFAEDDLLDLDQNGSIARPPSLSPPTINPR